MALYSRLANTALRMLTKYGQLVTLRRYSVGGADYVPGTGAATPSGPAGENDTTRRGVVVDAPGKTLIGSEYGATIEQGSLIQEVDRWIYLDANGAAPTLQDHIIIGTTEYSICNVLESNPGGTPLYYLVSLKA